MEQQEYAQRGYLREDFRLFHLKGAMEEQLDWHYHTFHKLIFFLGGQSGYGVEGRSYPLEPGDVILVPQGCVHRPEAAPGAPYERAILYLSPDYLARAGTADCPLDSCFTLATARFRFVLRPQEERQALRRTLFALESASVQPGFGQELLAKSLLTQLLILLRRAMDAQPSPAPPWPAGRWCRGSTGCRRCCSGDRSSCRWPSGAFWWSLRCPHRLASNISSFAGNSFLCPEHNTYYP